MGDMYDGVWVLFILACGTGGVGLALLVFATWLTRVTIGAWGDDWG